jgi:OH-DDVA oxygenase/3-O-methylgallate 3,4-dioxygenase
VPKVDGGNGGPVRCGKDRCGSHHGKRSKELFLEDITPAITVYWAIHLGSAADETQAARMPPAFTRPMGAQPPERREYPCLPELGTHICKTLVPNGWDLAVSKKCPSRQPLVERRTPFTGLHLSQIMRDEVVPHLPILMNTFFPPNQPTARRCFQLGQAVGAAIKSWDKGLRVAVFGSGGMSHFVIDEAFDRMFFEALRTRDARPCARSRQAPPVRNLRAQDVDRGGGILFDTDLRGDVVGLRALLPLEAARAPPTASCLAVGKL